jgi:hypothetical protein
MIGSAGSRRRRSVVATILAAGLSVALAVYLGAAPVEEDPEVYDLQHSRMYERQLEVIGGKSAVVGKEIDDWLASLWQGQRLAIPIAAATALAALACWAWDRGART